MSYSMQSQPLCCSRLRGCWQGVRFVRISASSLLSFNAANGNRVPAIGN